MSTRLRQLWQKLKREIFTVEYKRVMTDAQLWGAGGFNKEANKQKFVLDRRVWR